LRDFRRTTTFPTSNSGRDDIANSAFVRLEKGVFPAGMAFVAFANGERPASTIERARVRSEKGKEPESEHPFNGDPVDVARIHYHVF
jgi:hypothetical protein